jgi:hypothetical protein
VNVWLAAVLIAWLPIAIKHRALLGLWLIGLGWAALHWLR